MLDHIGADCGIWAESENLGPLRVTGPKRNKGHREVSVTVGFKADSGGEVNIGNRK